MMNRFLEEVFGIFNSRLLCDLFNHFHVNGLRHFKRWLHSLHGNRDTTVFATFSQLHEGGVSRKETQRLFSHGIGAFQITDAFEENGKVGRGGCMLVVQIQTDLKRLTSATGILLSFKKHASIEPCHVTGRV